MAFLMNPELQRRFEERMKRNGFATPEALVKHALDTLDQLEGEAIEDLDPETQASIEEGLAQAERGEGRPWQEVRDEITARFIDKK